MQPARVVQSRRGGAFKPLLSRESGGTLACRRTRFFHSFLQQDGTQREAGPPSSAGFRLPPRAVSVSFRFAKEARRRKHAFAMQAPPVGEVSQTRQVQPSIDTAKELILQRRRRQYIQEYEGGPVDRYLPAENPHRFMVEALKLTPEENVFQYVFAGASVLSFLALVAFPFWYFGVFTPYLEEQRPQEAAGAQVGVPALPGPFEVLGGFQKMADVLERPFPTLLLLFRDDGVRRGKGEEKDFFGEANLRLFKRVSELLSKHKVPLAVSALDVSDPSVPPKFSEAVPASATPWAQLVVPFAKDGEAGLCDIDPLKLVLGGEKEGEGDASGRSIGLSKPLPGEDPNEVWTPAASAEFGTYSCRGLLWAVGSVLPGLPLEIFQEAKEIDEEHEKFLRQEFRKRFVD
uniref:Transmembrane protein n=1 Tax=Chromera velia CCMP2878 TaxID=1169474 RepID=A0A0G4FW09_9ALVE|eukprot:Cvel_19064.t1-p1 / transcript=Cvel_19064.t1 / gene=Cvel_19064 / organism=Chromera_velia_CCMP2878 / gene_product=hypothetical protein / transcript_product=hypothetical protein / location=Cvel_scaffold1617:36014-40288(-) / protein_length=402 / sequence_SO=supercontig / SO=protein_coding / is_pseudo=false